ncbi:MAG: hypothetical protein E6J94_08730 [Methanobacteriota archaeon]|nr:MAG: hypothetical protein E6J99_07810 [Euryarchaeota archaeon]TMA05684.1 MAG: hypothetical protein E6J94_08730 [Euryarchaeota archaeon]
MSAPSALVLKCPNCGEVVPHRVLRGKIAGKDEIVFEGVVRCSKCDAISNVVTREPKPIVVPLILSWLDRSEKTSLEFSPDEDVAIGEELDLGDTRIAVTAIESAGRRVGATKAKAVDTIWAKRIDQVRVKFSVNKGNRTVPHDVLAAPDEEFEVGEIVDLGKDRAVVHHIRTRIRTMRQGRVRADEIVRMYGRIVRERTSR